MAEKPETQKRQQRAAASSDALVTGAIGKQLKRLYDDVAEEPVPDRFAELLEQLAKQERDDVR